MTNDKEMVEALESLVSTLMRLGLEVKILTSQDIDYSCQRQGDKDGA